uniref:Uncharacterized protein n=1 Tax=Thermofilum adornatum TaxID=1365176 RepID=A0A7C1GBT3_9CREN
MKKREKQRFFHSDTGWEERVPLKISVETFSTGNFNALREEDISENTFFPGPSSHSISFTMHNKEN